MTDTKHKKVVLLSGALRLSGSTTWIINLHHGFRRLNVDVIHIVTNRPGQENLPDDFQMYYTGAINKRLRVKLLRALRMHRWAPVFYQKVLDVMYDHVISEILDKLQWTGNVDLVIKDFTAYLPPVLSKYKVVATIHQKLSANWHMPELANKKNQSASIFVAVSSAVKEDACNLGIRVSHVIYNPIDVEAIVSKSEEYTPQIKNYIVFVGTLNKEKGIYELMQAFSQTEDAEYLVYVGDGREKNGLEKMAVDFGISNSIIFTGYVENPYPYIKHALLLVLPSYSEAMPYVPVEASILGTPAIVSGFEGAEEFFCNEVLVPLKPESHFVKKLSARIDNLLNYGSDNFIINGLSSQMQPEICAENFLKLANPSQE